MATLMAYFEIMRIDDDRMELRWRAGPGLINWLAVGENCEVVMVPSGEEYRCDPCKVTGHTNDDCQYDCSCFTCGGGPGPSGVLLVHSGLP
jgi:hypothetical protein